MSVSILDAVKAYGQTSQRPTKMAPAGENPVEDFGAMVKQAAGSAVETLKKGEQMSMKAIAGQAEIQEVIQAVAAAEVTLDTVVAVRDKVIQAYQEILRMPI